MRDRVGYEFDENRDIPANDNRATFGKKLRKLQTGIAIFQSYGINLVTLDLGPASWPQVGAGPCRGAPGDGVRATHGDQVLLLEGCAGAPGPRGGAPENAEKGGGN